MEFGCARPFTRWTSGAGVVWSMVLAAKAQGVSVLLAGIPPQRRFGARERVAAITATVNASIRALAQQHGVTFVDVFTPLSNGTCGRSGGHLPCVGRDDLHLTHAGYQVVALTFADARQTQFDVSETFRLTSTIPLWTNPSSHVVTVCPGRRRRAAAWSGQQSWSNSHGSFAWAWQRLPPGCSWGVPLR